MSRFVEGEDRRAGYSNEYMISKMYALARVHRIYGGTSEIMRTVIARSL